MTPALRTLFAPLFSALLLASPAAAGPRRAARMAPDGRSCLDLVPPGVLRAESLSSTPADREFGSVRLSGAGAVAADALWDLVGGLPSFPLSKAEAGALVSRLARSGLFAAVEPRIRTIPGEERAGLDIALSENPQVRSVQILGLSEFRTEDVVDRLLDIPTVREIEASRRELRDAWNDECPAPLPPRAWLARIEDGEIRGGVLWHGLRGALGRVLDYLRMRGYPLAHLQGELTPAGDLSIDLDEGRVGDVEVRGIDASLAGEVEKELGIRRGDVISSGELYTALERVRRRWPFLRADRRSRRPPPASGLRLEERSDGTIAFRSERQETDAPGRWDEDAWEVEKGPRRHRQRDDDDLDEDRPHGRRRGQPSIKRLPRTAWYAFEGDTLVVYLRTERSQTAVQWVELLRHTPVTGFAPGLAATLTLYDPGDRVHLMLDGAVNINTRRPSRDLAGGTYLERLNAQERVDWLLGPRVRIPALGIAEMGGQIHTLTDTADRWRISRIDSYLYSILLNRSDREYYRRSGFAAFVTAHLFEELTLGAEYRRDRYAPLAAPPRVWTIFNRDDPRYGSAPVEEGEMGSALFRLEYRSEKVPLHRVGSMWRNSETSVVEPEPWAIGVRSINTLEVADRSLGGIFDFTKVVSDTFLTVETGRYDAVTLRLRAAGGRDLPLQKEEALGGWTALRGYDFKEFRGTASVLATLQLEGRHLGAFLDVGSVRQAGAGWLDPKPSAGALLCFASKSTCAEAAWRLDGRAKALPDFRILFSVPL